MKFAITGASGLVGWHTRCALHASGFEAIAIDRSAFDDPEALRIALNGADVVVHAAGANRGDDSEISGTNIALAETLAKAVSDTADAPLVIYTNSTHIDRDTAYGTSKTEAAAILGEATDRFANVVLPGIFGEHGKPYYNSVVSTFCDQLADGVELSVNDDAQLELLHAQDAADLLLDVATSAKTGVIRAPGKGISVVALAKRLTELHTSYHRGVVPPIADHFDRSLFNTMRSYRFPSHYPAALEPRHDQRGHLVELVKADTGGQMFFSTTKPGITRGNHYHRRKVERFVVVEGQANISLRRMFSDEVHSFDVDGSSPVAIDMPTMHTHNITNIGPGGLTTVFWSDEIFDPEAPDTYGEVV